MSTCVARHIFCVPTGSDRVSRHGDVKLKPGGIRDIEFRVQWPAAPARRPRSWVRHGGTPFALFRLCDKGLLAGSEYASFCGPSITACGGRPAGAPKTGE